MESFDQTRTMYWPVDGHFNSHGNAVVSTAIFKALVSEGILTPEGRWAVR
jgi:hypothetical protein